MTVCLDHWTYLMKLLEFLISLILHLFMLKICIKRIFVSNFKNKDCNDDKTVDSWYFYEGSFLGLSNLAKALKKLVHFFKTSNRFYLCSGVLSSVLLSFPIQLLCTPGIASTVVLFWIEYVSVCLAMLSSL